MSWKFTRRFFLVLFCLQLAAPVSLAAPARPAAPQVPSIAPGIAVTESTEADLVLDLHFDQPILTIVQQGSTTYTDISMGDEFVAHGVADQRPEHRVGDDDGRAITAVGTLTR